MPSPPLRWLALAGLLVGGSLAAATTGAPPLGPAVVEPLRLDPAALRWSRVELVASKLFFTAETTIELSAADLATTRAGLPPDLAGLVLPGDGAVVVDVGSVAMGRRSRDRLWVRPTNAAALARFKEKLGKSPYEKVFRFAPDAVSLRRLSPKSDAEEDAGRPGWTKLEEKSLPLPAEAATCPTVIAPAALFYLLAVRPLATGEKLTVCVFSDPSLARLEIEAVRAEQTTVDLALTTPDGEVRRVGPRLAQRLALRPQALDGSPNRDFELLGLVGDVEIVLDPEERLPLRVEGQLESWGEVVVRLVRAKL